MSFASKFMKDDKIIINEDDKIKFMEFTPVNVLLSFGLTTVFQVLVLKTNKVKTNKVVI